MPRKKFYSSYNPNPIDVEIGKRLRKIRAIQGISQKDLGNYLDISFQQVQKYERASNKLSVSMLLEIASFFRVPAGYFIDGIVDYRDRHVRAPSKRDIVLLDNFNAISSRVIQDNIIDIVTAIKSHHKL